MLAVCLRFRVCFSICSRIFWYSPWLQQMNRQTAVSQNSASRPVGCSCRRSWVSKAKSCSMFLLFEKQSLSTAGLRMLVQGRSLLRSYCLMICCTFSNFWFLCACLKRNDPLSFTNRGNNSLSLAGSGSKPGSLISSVSLSISARPYSWRSQYMSHLTLGRNLLHSPPRSRQQTHSSTSLQKKLLTSLSLSAQAKWMCLMAAIGSMRCAQASAWLTCGTSYERPACSQASAAEAYRSSWQQMLPELTMIQFGSGQFSSYSRKEQMARSVSAVARKLLS